METEHISLDPHTFNDAECSYDHKSEENNNVLPADFDDESENQKKLNGEEELTLPTFSEDASVHISEDFETNTKIETAQNDEETDGQQETSKVQQHIIKEDSADERFGEVCSNIDKQQMFPRNRKMKFQYNNTSLIVTDENRQNTKIKRRVYITSCQANEPSKSLTIAMLEPHLAPIAKGKIELKETNCGLLVTFFEEDDFTKMMRMTLSKVFETPVAVWNIPHVNSRINNAIIIRDIPWCIKAKEIEDILNTYGIYPLHSARNEDGSVKVVVKNPYSLSKLLREGLNFYNCIILPVSLEPSSNPDIIQCYRCQRFWHTAQYCPFFERCVRCGEKHDFRTCTRDRNNPNCCLCGDSHHAAYKYCPVRIQHLNALQIEVNMERE